MTFQQLAYLVELSKHASISAAAQSLGISQPSLSLALKELEKEFHLTLLHRNRRGISFTAEGIEFLRFATSIIQQTEQLHRRFPQEKTSRQQLQLTISAQPAPWFAAALAQILPAATDMPYTVTLRESPLQQVISDVANRRSHIGFLFLSERTEPYLSTLFDTHHLTCTKLCHFSPHVYVRTDHPLAAMESLTLQDLRTYPYARLEFYSDKEAFGADFFSLDTQTSQQIHVTDRASLFSILRTTLAYTLSTGYFPQAFTESGLCALPLTSPTRKITLAWIQINNISLPAAAKEYLEHVSHTLKGFNLT